MIAHRVIIFVICTALASCAPATMAPGGSSTARIPVNHAARPQAPVLKRLKNGHYRVRKPWTVVLNGRTFVIPKGYTSNGLTSPLRVKAAIGDGVDHPETWAAVFHDWLFTQPGISRETADQRFYDLLIAYGVAPGKANLMYTTVKAFSLSTKFR